MSVIRANATFAMTIANRRLLLQVEQRSHASDELINQRIGFVVE